MVKASIKTPKLKKKVSISDDSHTPLKSKKIVRQKTPKLKRAVELSGLEVKVKKQQQFKEINRSDVKKAVAGVIKFASENPKLQNQLFGEKFPLFLQVSLMKIPKGVGKVMRIPLKNPILTPDDDICMIVADVKGIPNKEHERHLEHYEQLFAKHKIDNIKKIMTFHEFRTEYETFELRSRLVDLYECFLTDAKVGGKVIHKCGKVFYKKRKLPTSIKLTHPKLKSHIEKNLLKTQFNLTNNGDNYTIQFGHSKMDVKELVENVYSVIEALHSKEFPGQFENIKNIHVTAHRATSIPIYLNLKNPNEVKVPVMKPTRKLKGPKTVKGELSTVTNAEVIVQRDGTVKVLETEETKADPDEITINDLVNDIKKIQKKHEDPKKVKKAKKRSEDEIVVENEKTLGKKIKKQTSVTKKKKVQKKVKK